MGLRNINLFKSFNLANKASSLYSRVFSNFSSNTIKKSKEQIKFHYDLGNKFYSKWLDRSMTYSSGIFENKNIVVIPSGQVVGLLRLLVKHCRGRKVVDEDAGKLVIALQVYSQGYAEIFPTANTSQQILPPGKLTHLDRLEAESIHIIREAMAEAENPVIVVDRYANSQGSVNNLIKLAELLQAPVVEQMGRMNFPNTHYLRQGAGVAAQADVILSLEVKDTWNIVNRTRDKPDLPYSKRTKPDVKIITLGMTEVIFRSNYQDMNRFFSADLSIIGDGS